MEMQETERELRRTLEQIDPRPARPVASSTPPASSHVRRVSPSNESENTIQPPAVKPNTPHDQAAGDGVQSIDQAESNDPEEHG